MIVGFPRGAGGAHQVVNEGTAPVRMLAVSTSGEPDVVLYPDSGKVGVADRRVGGGGLVACVLSADAVGL